MALSQMLTSHAPAALHPAPPALSPPPIAPLVSPLKCLSTELVAQALALLVITTLLEHAWPAYPSVTPALTDHHAPLATALFTSPMQLARQPVLMAPSQTAAIMNAHPAVPLAKPARVVPPTASHAIAEMCFTATLVVLAVQLTTLMSMESAKLAPTA